MNGRLIGVLLFGVALSLVGWVAWARQPHEPEKSTEATGCCGADESDVAESACAGAKTECCGAEKCDVAGPGCADAKAGCCAEEKCDAKPVALCPVSGEAIKTCPVSGKPLKSSVWAGYGGGKVYFRCGGCLAKFQEKPEKYAAKANLQLVATGQARQVACPLSGEKAVPDHVLRIGGIDVAFCRDGCTKLLIGAAEKDQIELIFGKHFKTGYTLKKEEDKTKDKNQLSLSHSI